MSGAAASGKLAVAQRLPGAISRWVLEQEEQRRGQRYEQEQRVVSSNYAPAAAPVAATMHP